MAGLDAVREKLGRALHMVGAIRAWAEKGGFAHDRATESERDISEALALLESVEGEQMRKALVDSTELLRALPGDAWGKYAGYLDAQIEANRAILAPTESPGGDDE